MTEWKKVKHDLSLFRLVWRKKKERKKKQSDEMQFFTRDGSIETYYLKITNENVGFYANGVHFSYAIAFRSCFDYSSTCSCNKTTVLLFLLRSLLVKKKKPFVISVENEMYTATTHGRCYNCVYVHYIDMKYSDGIRWLRETDLNKIDRSCTGATKTSSRVKSEGDAIEQQPNDSDTVTMKNSAKVCRMQGKRMKTSKRWNV